ncbi:MAG: hypothetical protein ACRDMV_24810 [Streptosporangiales bacterium]
MSRPGSPAQRSSLATVADLLVVSCFGVIATYLCERFPVSVRASGYGIGFSLAVVIPSFYAFFQAGLGEIMPFAYTPAALLVVGGALISVGAAIGPETRDVDMSDQVGSYASGQDAASRNGVASGVTNGGGAGDQR